MFRNIARLILKKLKNSLTSQNAGPLDPARENHKKINISRFVECYGCDGTGQAQNISGLDRFMPSKHSHYYQDREWGNSYKCPICNGTGYMPRMD